MSVFIVFFIVLVFMDMVSSKVKLSKKEKKIYIILLLISLGFGIFYFSNPFRQSIVEMVFRVLKIE